LPSRKLTAAQIDTINILRATHRAMNEALAKLNPQPQHALWTGGRSGTMRVPQTAIVKGDAREVIPFAAASVLAKVTREPAVMLESSTGAGRFTDLPDTRATATARHSRRLRRMAPAQFHRRSFAPLKAKELKLYDTDFTDLHRLKPQ